MPCVIMSNNGCKRFIATCCKRLAFWDSSPRPPIHSVVAFTPRLAHHLNHSATEDWFSLSLYTQHVLKRAFNMINQSKINLIPGCKSVCFSVDYKITMKCKFCIFNGIQTLVFLGNNVKSAALSSGIMGHIILMASVFIVRMLAAEPMPVCAAPQPDVTVRGKIQAA